MGEIFKEFMNMFSGDDPIFKKLIKLIIVSAIILASVLVLESAMGLVTLGRLERKANLLKELNAMTQTGLGNQSELQTLFNDTVSNLKLYNPEFSRMLSNFMPNNHKPNEAEVLVGAVLWLLMGLAMLKSTPGGWATKLSGSGIVWATGLGIGLFGDWIIDTPFPLLAFLLNLIFGAIPLILLAYFLVARKEPRKEPVNAEPSDNSAS